MDYYQFNIQASPENTEILIAFLSELPFDTFQENDKGFEGYIPESEYSGGIDEHLENLAERFDFTFQKSLIKSKNWNSVWESNFEPIVVGDFCGIRADFHQPISNVNHEIIINPKMAFGTGHHETTYMVIQMMETLDFADRKVLDYGCGTGILAILAAKLYAKTIDAVDIEIQSFENTIENAAVNSVQNINTMHGTLENVKRQGFETILANITRNLILDTLGSLSKKLLKNGNLIVSGILKKDEQILVEKALKTGFTLEKTILKNNWVCLLFVK